MTSPGSNEVEITVMVRDLATAGMRGIGAVARGLGAAVGPIMSLGKGLAAVGAAGGAVNVVAGLGAALATAAPAALALPGVLLGAAAAAQTVKLAFSGMGEAIAAADPVAFAEATKDMAPAARDAASAVRDLREPFEELRRSVQAEFFAGLAPMIRSAGTALIDTLGTGLPAIAAGFNQMGREALAVAETPFFRGRLGAILDGTSGALGNMRSVLADLLSGFSGLGAIGAEYLPAIGAAIGNATARFREWVEEGLRTGEIRDMIDRALVALRQLGEIAGNVGGAIGAVFRGLAGNEDYSVFLDNLVELSGALREALSTTEAQAALGALGEALRAVSGAMGDVLLATLEAAFPVIQALAPVVVALAEAFRASLVDSGLLATIGTLLTSLVTALVDSGLLDAFVQLASTVGGALTTALVAAAPLLVEIATALGEFLAGAINQLVESGLLEQMIVLFLRMVTVLWPLVPPILELALQAFPLFVGAAQAAMPVLEFLASVIEGLTPVLQGLIGIVTFAVDALAQNFANIRASAERWGGDMQRRIDEVVGFFRDLPGRIMGFLAGLPGMLADSGWRMLQSFGDGIRRGFNSAVRIVQDGLASLRRFFPFSPAKEGPFAGAGYVDHSGTALVGDFAAAIRGGMPDVLGAARDVLGGAQGALAAGIGANLTLAGAGAGAPAVALPGAGPGAGSGGVVVLEIVNTGGDAVGEFVLELLRRHIRVRGGNVQAVLGRPA